MSEVGEKVKIPRPAIPAFAERVESSSDDSWAHRSQAMRCRTCMWFVPKGDSGPLGRCRRRSPTHDGYPAVFEADWCGDHKLDENKV